LSEAAGSTEGVTGSFAKELIRRSVLTAAVAGEDLTDAHLVAALKDLMDGRQRLTRRMLGTTPPGAIDLPDDESGGASPGWFAYQPPH
jgi:hypothetical protein